MAVASALSAVHQVGLIHRDIKPANVVEAAGVYKLIDFGIAAAERRAKRESVGTLPKAAAKKKNVLVDDLMLEVETKASVAPGDLDAEGGTDGLPLTGTFGYMDPFCFQSASQATAASDLYALGAMLFECVAGRVPAAAAARAEGATGLKMEVLVGRAPAPSLATAAQGLPASLVKLVDALLEPSPAKRPRSAEAVAWELERIRREIAGRVRPLPPEDVGPFRGLARFEEKDRDVYFGRATEIAASLELVRSRGLLALIGASGSGKSSLARAGVLPAIADGGLGKWPKTWATAVASPGIDARASIAGALAPFVHGAAGKSAEAMVTALGERAQSSGEGVCLLVDQLEELVTVSSPESRDYAVQLLAQLGAQAIPGVRCVVAARRDLLDPLLALGELGRVLTKGSLLVSPMTDSTWGEVVDQALAAYGYELEDDALRRELLAQLKGTATAMPLVQFALTQLWERRDKAKKRIPREALKAIGGIAGALEMHADATVATLVARDSRASSVARRVLLAMTTPQGTRRIVPQADLEKLDSLAPAVLEKLAEARLAVQEAEGVTLAHEALLTQWGKLKGWIGEAREDRLLAEAIERDAKEWASGHEAERLWKKRRLVAAQDLARKGDTELTETSRAFIGAARAAERRGRLVLGAISVAVLLSAAGGTTAYVLKTKAAQRAAQAAQQQAETAQQRAEVAKKDADGQRLVAVNNANELENEKTKLQAEKQRADDALAELKVLAEQVAKAKTATEYAEAQARLNAAIQRGSGAASAAPTATTQAQPRPAATVPPSAVERVGEPP